MTFLLLVIYYCAKDWGQQHLKRCVQNKDKQGVLDPDWGQNTEADLDDFFLFSSFHCHLVSHTVSYSVNSSDFYLTSYFEGVIFRCICDSWSWAKHVAISFYFHVYVIIPEWTLSDFLSHLSV